MAPNFEYRGGFGPRFAGRVEDFCRVGPVIDLARIRVTLTPRET
jgi:hypothetical protein